jgi:hypothetical protein
MDHSHADISRYLLIDLDLGTVPTDEGAWPIFADREPESPDDCITVYNTQGLDEGRDMISGELFGHQGIQVRVRAAVQQTGWAKATAIQKAMAESVLRTAVSISSSDYLVQCFAKIGDVLNLGKHPTSNRYLFTINAVVSARQLP